MTTTAGWTPRRGRIAPAATASLAAFGAAAVGAGLGRALMTTYLPVLLSQIRDAPGLIGTVMLVNTVAGFAVPLWIGLWSDRLHARGHSRTGPFVVGGSLVAAAGLAAAALGHGTSYALLALCAAVTYAGLNAVTTAHRALVPERYGEDRGAAATGAQEFALLAGTGVGVVVGGVLVEAASWAPFAFGAAALPLLVLPTAVGMRGRERPIARERPAPPPFRYYLGVVRAPGTRLLLSAQLLWVAGYIGLAPFFVLYADRELGLPPSRAGLLLALFGVFTGIAILAAGSIAPDYRMRTLLLGVLLLGGGLLGASTTTSLRFVAPALVAAAAGFGTVTTLGFAVFTRFIPAGEEAAYSAVYFAVRAVAAAIAVPATGWTIEASGSYRAMLVLGGAVALLAVAPLAAATPSCRALRRPALGRVAVLTGALLAVSGVVTALAVVTTRTRLSSLDADVFDLMYGLGGTPRAVDAFLVDPHIQNYVALVLIAAVAAVAWRPSELVPVVTLVPLAGVVSFGIVRVIWALWDRPRPEELLGVVPANGHFWAPYPSFPSGHVVVTVALVTTIALRVGWLTVPLAAYAAVIAVTRVAYGAHFPLDVAGGVVIGLATALVVTALATESRLVAAPGRQLRPRPLDPGRARALSRTALATGAVAVTAFVALAATIGAPRSPEGGVLPAATAATAQHALLAVAALAIVLGLRAPAGAGAVLVVTATALGVLAALEYSPLVAVVPFFLLFAPGLALLLSSDVARSPRRTTVIAAVAVVILLVGAFGALRVHAAAFGPTHPESATRPLPVTVVRWAWAGGVTGESFRVVAKLAWDGDARLLVSGRPDLSAAIATAPERASHDDNDRIVAFEANGLAPDRVYYYAVESRGTVDRARAGRVRTFARSPASFTFAFGGCARVGSNGAVFDAIRARNPLFFLLLGDFFYANIDEDDEEAFRNQYDRALTQPAQAALYRNAPVAYVWDDHDFGPNDADASSPSAPAARAAYERLVPHYRLPDRRAVYHAFTVGRVRFIVTDTRAARTAASMLGARQERWLRRELLGAKRRGALAVWVTSVPWIADTGGDNWSGHPAERRALADFVAQKGIRNLLMLSGDAHMVAIDDGTNNDYASAGGGSFPVMHAAALDRRGDVKGGPFSEGMFPGSGQFGTVTVTDDGGARVTVRLTGWNHRGERLVEHAFTRTLGDPR